MLLNSTPALQYFPNVILHNVNMRTPTLQDKTLYPGLFTVHLKNAFLGEGATE